MEHNREMDTKILINSESFLNLINKLSISLINNTLIQNHYFDTTEHHIFQETAVLRIRQQNNSFLATFKKSIKKQFLVKHSEYVSKDLLDNWKVGNFQNSKFKKLLDEINVDTKKVSYLGTLVTHRYTVIFKKCQIFIDHSIYNNVEDYEIECEASDNNKAEMVLISFIEKYNIKTLNSRVNKYTRFLNAVSRVKNDE